MLTSMSIFTFILSVFSFQQFDPQILDGYTNKLSAYPGDSINLHLNASFYTAAYEIKLYDLSEKIVYRQTTPVFSQRSLPGKAYETGFGYKRTCRVAIPNLPSGIYLWEKQIPFVIKTVDPKIIVVYSSNTANAYCASGGKSLYGFNSSEKTAAQIVSFHRPIQLPRHSEAFFQWAFKENIPGVGYITDVDLEDYNNFRKSKVLIIAGHSEYWTYQSRRNFDRYVNSGRHAMILSGNTMWWQVRYNKTKDQMICYRDKKADPIKNEKLKTINWCEPSLQYPIVMSTGTDFRNAGYGTQSADNGWDGYKIISNSPLLEGTSIKVNDIVRCPSDELDGAPIAEFINQVPIVDYKALGFSRVEIVGYDLVQRSGKEGIATWIVFKANKSSGTVINTASTDWCSWRGIGANTDIQKITSNMIRKLVNDENVFSSGDPTELVN